MPTYTYSCPDGHKFDITKLISEWTPTEKCTVCTKESKQIHTDVYTGISFNTTGFYETDWKRKK